MAAYLIVTTIIFLAAIQDTESTLTTAQERSLENREQVAKNIELSNFVFQRLIPLETDLEHLITSSHLLLQQYSGQVSTQQRRLSFQQYCMTLTQLDMPTRVKQLNLLPTPINPRYAHTLGQLTKLCQSTNTNLGLLATHERYLGRIHQALKKLQQDLNDANEHLRNSIQSGGFHALTAMESQQQLLQKTSLLLEGTLALLLVFAVIIQIIFFKILNTRLGTLSQYARNIAEKIFSKQPFVAPDCTGQLAQSLASTGLQIQQLLQDISKQATDAENARGAAEKLAFYDPLTRLENRRYFTKRLKEEAKLAIRSPEHKLMLLYIDLDNFKTINDSLGHSAGDKLLKMVADRLAKAARGGDCLARLGGDEFALLAHNDTHQQGSQLAQRILDLLEPAFIIDNRSFKVTASIGIASTIDAHCSPEDLLRHADLAMYQAKKHGRNTYRFFEHQLNVAAQEKIALLNNLRLSIEQNHLTLHFQKKCNISTMRCCGLEALVRWNHPEMGLISPGDFIPVAEESGLIFPLGEWVLNEACRTTASFFHQGIKLPVAVNISARQFYETELPVQIERALEQFSLPADMIEIELTESMLMQNVEQSIATMQQLKRIGVTIALDDFGTGFSSLNYLKNFPFDVLKIDRSFIRNVTQCKREQAIATSILELAHKLNLIVVAEGIETRQQLNFLAAHRCHIAQGYLLHQPSPASELVT